MKNSFKKIIAVLSATAMLGVALPAGTFASMARVFAAAMGTTNSNTCISFTW